MHGDEMKKSTEILAELHETLACVGRLHAEAEANQPQTSNRRMNRAEELENERRRDRLDAIKAELTKANAHATRLRKSHAEAFAAEQAPKPPAPSEALMALYKRRDELVARLEELRHARSAHALLAAEGNAEAQTALTSAIDELAVRVVELKNLSLAIKKAEARDHEQRHSALQRDADEKYHVGIAAADELIVWAEKFDNLLGYIGAHFAKLPELQKALAKSGADINTDLTNKVFCVAARDRAARAAGLRQCFSMDATVAAAPLANAFRSLLKAAVRRPG